MATEIGICNFALTMLSTTRIESLGEDSENARKCNAIFDIIRDGLLEDHDWGFARGEATLALLASSPVVTDWSYIYQLPTDCLAVRYNEDNEPYKIVADTMYTNYTAPNIIYTKRIENTSLFPAKFVVALGWKLAEALSFGVTQNATMAQNAARMAAIAIKEAKWSDSQQGQGMQVVEGNLLSERQR